MTPILIIVIYVCSACGVGSVVVIVGRRTMRIASAKRSKLLNAKYIESVSAILNNQVDINLRLPGVTNSSARLALINILSQVSSTYYGYNNRAIAKLVDIYELDKELLRRIARSRGKQRALYIQMAAKLPLSKETFEKCRRYADDTNRYVRLYAMLLHLNQHPEMTYQIIDSHPHHLTNLELRQVVNTIANNQMSISIIGSFLNSPNYNLQFLGLELVQLYEYRELLPKIERLLKSDNNHIRQKALNTLVKLHSDINDTAITSTIATLRTPHRKLFYRHCINEGYSIRSFESLINYENDRSLKNYITNSINSHKKDLSVYS